MDPLEWFNRNVLGNKPKPPSSTAIVPQTQQIFTNQNVPTPTGPRGMTPRLPGTKVGAPTTPLLKGDVPKPAAAAPAAGQTAQGFLKGSLGKLVGGIIRVDGAATAMNPSLPITERVEGGLTAGFPLIGAAYAALKGAAESGDYGGMTAIAGQDLTTPLPKDYAFDGSAVKGAQKPKPETRPAPSRKVGEDYTVAGVTYDGKTHRPKDAPGGGYSLSPDGSMAIHQPVTADTDTPTPTETPTPTPTETPTPSPTGPTQETTRTNENGIEQKGKDLSSINSGLSAVGVGPLEDMGRFFTEGFIPGVKGQDSSTNMGFDSPNAETGTWSEEEGRIIEPSAGSATGGRPENVQDGTSGKPTVAEKVRQIRGARQQEFAARPGSRTFEQPDETPAASGPNAMRRAARSAFLDAPAGSGYNAIRARDAAVGISNDGVLLDGELRQWADGVDEQTKRRAAYAATGGFGTREKLDEWTGQFLQPGSQKAPEKAEPQVPSDVVMQKAAADFKDFFMKNKV